MKLRSPTVAWAMLLAGFTLQTAAQTIFNEDFDGGYTGSFATSAYSGGSPTGTTNFVQASGGKPNGCWRETMTTTTWGDYYTGQIALMTVTGITDPNPADFVLSFDAYGSQAAAIQFIIQTWPYNYFAGTGPVINVITNCQLLAANHWQTFRVNLGSLTAASSVAATWQLEFQINSWLWGGPGFTDTLTIDNLVLTQVRGLAVTASAMGPQLGQLSDAAAAEGGRLPGATLAGRLEFGRLPMGQRPNRERHFHERGHESRSAGVHHGQLRHRHARRSGGLGALGQPDEPMRIPILGNRQ
jgi:hypothetical protein